MEKILDNKTEAKERKERRNFWSRLGVIALASSMAAACVEKSAAVREGATEKELSEQGMRVAGEDASIEWKTEAHKDAQGYTINETLHAKILSRGKVYRVDLDLGPLHTGARATGDNIVVPVEGYPVSGGSDPTSVSWYDMDNNGNGLVVKFIPLVDQEGNDALEVLTMRYEDGRAKSDNVVVDRPNVVE